MGILMHAHPTGALPAGALARTRAARGCSTIASKPTSTAQTVLLAKLLHLLVACTLALFALSANARPLAALQDQNTLLEKIELLPLDAPRAWLAQAVDSPEENTCFYDDGASGPTHYNDFRSYQASQGRYTQADPIGLEGGLNRFGYVEGNPLGAVDPDGRLAWFVPALITGGLTGYGAYKTTSNLNACVKSCEVTQGDAVQACGTPERADIVEASSSQRINQCKSRCTFGAAIGQLVPKYNILKPGLPR